MRLITFALIMISGSATAFAQLELGVTGGAGLLNSVSVSGTAGSATAGFAPGPVAGVFAGEPFFHSNNFSGEVRYEYMQSDLRLSSAGQSAQFSGVSHAIHYDFLYRTDLKESRMQFFGALGGGVKVFSGTGAEAAYQPLSQFGYFTKTSMLKPMATAGAGVVFTLAPKLRLRVEVRDFITGFPTSVLTPAPGVKFGSLLNEIVPMVSLVYAK
jgi:hypothetical protein